MNGAFDVTTLWQWFLIVQAVGTLFMLLLVLWLGTKFTKREEHAALIARVEKLDNRVATVEDRLTRGDSQFERLDEHFKALPTREDMANLKISIERLSGQQDVVKAQIDGFAELFRLLDRQVRTMDDYLRAK